MKFIDILHMVSFNAKLICYINEEKEPIWTGYGSQIPYWLAELELADSKYGEEAIDFRHSLGKEFNDEPGFVVTLKDEEE